MKLNVDFLEKEDGTRIDVDQAKEGDRFFVKCTGDWIYQVDSKTKKCTQNRQLFELKKDGALKICR